MKHDGGWKRLASRYLFQSPWFNVRQDKVELPEGEQIPYTTIEHPGYAAAFSLSLDGQKYSGAPGGCRAPRLAFRAWEVAPENLRNRPRTFPRIPTR